MKKESILCVCVLMLLISEVECYDTGKSIFETLMEVVKKIKDYVQDNILTSRQAEKICPIYLYLKKCTSILNGCGVICNILESVCIYVASLSDFATRILCVDDATVYSKMKEELFNLLWYYGKRFTFQDE